MMIHSPTTRSRGHRLIAAVGTLSLAGASLLAVGAAPAMAASPICATFERADVSGGAYVVQNNAWGNTPGQCVQPRDGGFTITTAEGSIDFGGAPKSYPSIFAGEHYGEGSDTASLPVKVSEIGSARTSAEVTKAPGAWNAAWDIWVNSSPDSPEENDDTEIMVWADQQGGPTPIGEKVDTITVEGRDYDVWRGPGSGGTDVISYVDVETTTSPDIPLAPFLEDSVSRGATSEDSWVTSVQFGFEPWKRGEGLAVKDFIYSPTAERAARTTGGAEKAEQSGDEQGDQGGEPQASGGEGDRAPGQVLDLEGMHLTLPTGSGGTPDQVEAGALGSFTDAEVFHTDGDAVVMRAPVQGVSTSKESGATRTELNADQTWQPGEPPGELRVSMSVDATHASDRQEVIVAQIHSASHIPPVYLAVEQKPDEDSRLRVFAAGPGYADLLTGIEPDTTFTAWLRPRGDGSVQVAAVKDEEDLDAVEPVTIPASLLAGDGSERRYQVGAYNKSPIDGGGTGYTQVRVTDLTIGGDDQLARPGSDKDATDDAGKDQGKGDEPAAGERVIPIPDEDS